MDIALVERHKQCFTTQSLFEKCLYSFIRQRLPVTYAMQHWSLQECDTLVECARGRSLAEYADGDHDWAAKTRSLFCLASRAFVLCLCRSSMERLTALCEQGLRV